MSAAGAVLALNSGSSSLKLAVFTRQGNADVLALAGSADDIGSQNGTLVLQAGDGSTILRQDGIFESQTAALERLANALAPHLQAPLVAVGHRVVHGGPNLQSHQQITPALLQQLADAVHFAPLHIPEALRSVQRAQALFPGIPHFACFDTAFHRTLPVRSTRLPIPQRFAEQGVRRYGFHGLSCDSVMHRLGPQPPARVVIAHLGGGCSITAVKDGKSLDNSMGMSPTGGVPMGTRTGDLDPAVLLYLLRSGLSGDELEQLVNHECGLYGLSGGESDMQALEQKSAAGDTRAALAIEIFCTEIAKFIAGYIALLGGLDCLVFTGGIGEHSASIRTRICDGLKGLTFGSEDAISKTVKPMPAQEEVQIARICRSLLQGDPIA